MTPPPLSLPEPTSEPAGYAWLVRKYELIVLPNWRWTFIADRNVHKELDRDGTVQVLLPRPRSPASTDISHLLFALKNDGVSLSIWRELLRVADLSSLAAEIEAAVRKTPTGAYARRAWFLFEALSGTELGLNDVQAGNYVPLLDPKVHVTGPTRKHRRQRIDINLLGTLQFSPVLRWTDELRAVSGERLRSRIEEVVAG